MGLTLKNSLRSKNMGYAFMRGDVTNSFCASSGPSAVSSVPWSVNARSG